MILSPAAAPRRARHRRARVRAGTLAALLALFARHGHAQQPAAAPPPPLPLYPAPREPVAARADGFALPQSVALVTGAGSDAAAVREVTAVLRAAGVTRVVPASDESGAPRGARVVVYVGAPGANRATQAALDALGARGPQGLPAEGFTLAAGRAGGGGAIVLAGVDARGTFYAAHALRQLIARGRVRAAVVRDAPALAIRGVIEGFYGPPWSHEERLRQLEFYGAHRLNTYVYAPKDDPFHRERWREPYPPAALARMGELVAAAQRHHVDFVFAVSPGPSACYSDDGDYAALVAKAQALWDLGVRAFAVLLDDIDPVLRCAADRARFGRDANPPAAAQAFLLNRFRRSFLATHPGAARLITVPTDYAQPGSTPYRERFAALVDRDVVVYWTGVGVIAPTVTAADADRVHGVFRHELLLWDNYPVNDYARAQLMLGPLVGRASDLAAHHHVGITANPMPQAQASLVALATVAEYAWNPGAYEPEAAFARALQEVGGPASDALRVFAEVNRNSPIDTAEATPLARELAAYWDARGRDAAVAAARLDARLATVGRAPALLRARLRNPALLAEIAPWLDKLARVVPAARTALTMLAAQARGAGAAAWQARRAFEAELRAADALDPVVGRGALDSFLDRARTASDAWFGAGFVPATSMGAFDDDHLAQMLDGDDATYYWSGRPPVPGDFVALDLRATRALAALDLRMGSTVGPDPQANDFFRNGAIELSTDGQRWQPAGVMRAADTRLPLPTGTRARYVRVRATEAQTDWVRVREFGVTGELPRATLSSTSSDAAAPGAPASAAVDGSVTTAYRAASAPRAGEALTVALAPARALERLVVLLGDGAAARAAVEVRAPGGAFRPAGRLAGAYTSIALGGQTLDAVRLVWAAGSPPPVVHEVIAVEPAAAP